MAPVWGTFISDKGSLSLAFWGVRIFLLFFFPLWKYQLGVEERLGMWSPLPGTLDSHADRTHVRIQGSLLRIVLEVGGVVVCLFPIAAVCLHLIRSKSVPHRSLLRSPRSRHVRKGQNYRTPSCMRAIHVIHVDGECLVCEGGPSCPRCVFVHL